MNSIFVLSYSIILFSILVVLTFYIARQILNSQKLETNVKKLQKNLKQSVYSNDDLYKLGQLYLRKKLFNKALLVFREALICWDLNDKIGIGSLANTIGFTYFKLKKYNFAIYYYKVAVKILPDYLLAFKNLAFVYESLSFFQDASNCYQNCLALDSTNDFFINRLKLIQRQLVLESTTSNK
uniref:Uncharacterized protein n=1 Tax=Dictyopteris divaricata TaxID=156996 RepID=A0A2I4Q2M9_9PHAE|nr:hypothetical protein [Dictyopteris divaricata]YP_010205254.1 hypothetical protein LK366_pgp137 [Grateloupia livida]AQZ25102.1 hypothetical protein [Dictyopteris divaricata]UAV85823.1 hypothetical protein [Grateloupia livida]